MIWDFRGPSAAKTAKHHAQHLKEYATIEKLQQNIAGSTTINEMHSIAYILSLIHI